MGDRKQPRTLVSKATQPDPISQEVSGQAAAAKKNREREVRHCIIQALLSLGIRYDQWPDFVLAFYTDPLQRTQYRQCMTPEPFHAPEFDRLNQSVEEWVRVADEAWERHRQRFLQQCQDWVRAGVDEEIVAAKRNRSPGKRVPAQVGGRKRGDNTPLNRRYEWAAKYLLKIPLKEIAGGGADASTVGRVAREIVRLAGWATK
jgi:hypothetical protein